MRRKVYYRKSWAKWFDVMVRTTRMVERHPFSTSPIPNYVRYAKNVLPRFDKSKAEACVTGHAPWLNEMALAYRRSMGRPTVNGFYVG